MKRIVLLIAIFSILFTACSNRSTPNTANVLYPTPTNYKQFSENNATLPAVSAGENMPPVTPTVSNIFNPPVIETPQITPSSIATEKPVQPTKIDLTAINYRTISIFGEQVNPNWEIFNSERTEVDPENNQFTYSGTKSIKITPGEDFSPVFFVVRSDAAENYPRDRVLGIEFKLSSGKTTIEPSDLAVTVVGSNQYTYYVSGDQSVTNKVDPIFPETRLNYLGINQTIPPDTWTDVSIWMDDLIYDPIYTTVTGFYLKNDEGFRDTFYLDDVRLILASNEQAAVTPEVTPSAGVTQIAISTSESVTSVQVNVDLTKNVKPINPMIYGVSSGTADVFTDLKPGLNSWGGNPSSRYNWLLGNSWNAGRDFFYQNTNYDNPTGSASDRFITQSQIRGIATRMSLSTLGWVAKNSNPKSCSFPLPDGTCGNANEASCLNPGEIADPGLANVKSDVNSILEWVRHMVDTNLKVTILAMDNEPELWGITHYDVHPQCTTYQEIVDKYLEYALPIRELAPNIKLAGPVTSGWQYYWNSAAGEKDKQQNGNQDFLPWFLDQVKKHDDEKGISTIDVLDIHYYPEGLYNIDVDPETAAHRMRATRSFWDPAYIDESWINEPVNLIPRMKELIAKHYPGLQLGISEWNMGADENINGALAIADVLGIFGREDVYYASYWKYPPKNSPGALAFRMFTNYDGYGNKFGDTSVFAESDNPDHIGAYASLDEESGQVNLIVINKNPKNTIQVKLNFENFTPPSKTRLYRYSREDLEKIVNMNIDWPEDSTLQVPPYSINHYILTP